jgi:hypothetical protein
VVSKKSTLPLGVNVLGELAVTVAVNVRAVPKYCEPVNEPADVVGAGLTTWLTALLVLVLKLVSPPYLTVIECVATLSDGVVSVA